MPRPPTLDELRADRDRLRAIRESAAHLDPDEAYRGGPFATNRRNRARETAVLFEKAEAVYQAAVIERAAFLAELARRREALE